MASRFLLAIPSNSSVKLCDFYGQPPMSIGVLQAVGDGLGVGVLVMVGTGVLDGMGLGEGVYVLVGIGV